MKKLLSQIYIYFCEAIYHGIAESTGFSGFEIEGKVVKNENEIKIEPGGWTSRYNVWRWVRS